MLTCHTKKLNIIIIFYRFRTFSRDLGEAPPSLPMDHDYRTVHGRRLKTRAVLQRADAAQTTCRRHFARLRERIRFLRKAQKRGSERIFFGPAVAVTAISGRSNAFLGTRPWIRPRIKNPFSSRSRASGRGRLKICFYQMFSFLILSSENKRRYIIIIITQNNARLSRGHRLPAAIKRDKRPVNIAYNVF